jgi:arylformamidase
VSTGSTVGTDKVWRDFDQVELDRQYNSRGTVPDHMVYVREYAERTRAAKANLAWAEFAYGDGPADRLDVYPAAHTAGGPGAPVLVFLHGGDWRALSKEDSGFGAQAYTAAGATFVVPDFSLVPDTTIPAMGAQLRRALAWVWQNIAAHGGDPARIFVAGHSSGANLVSQLLTCDWAREFRAPADRVKGAVFMSGLGDLEPVRLSFRNQWHQLDQAMVAEASLLRGKPGTACPMILAYGEHETSDYKRQGREVQAWWAAQGNRTQFFELAGRNHFDAVLEWADPKSALFRATLEMMGLG